MPHRQINNEYSFTLFDSAASIPCAEWEQVTGPDTIFLKPAYLEVLEHCFHTRLSCRYVIVYHRHKPCGVIYYQVVDFKAGLFGSLLSKEVETIRSRKMNLFERYLHSNKDEILLRLFTCGNNLVSGDHGFCFAGKISKEKCHELLLTITDLVAREEKLRGTISAILLKDFYAPLKPAKLFSDENYSRFSVEPNLIVKLPPQVKSMEDYIGLFSKKYRNRARSIFRNLDGIEIRELSADEIADQEKNIYALYSNVFAKAKFRLMQLPLKYFSSVKKIFDETFTVKAFYDRGKLIAFCSSFVMADKSLEAHYIGFDYEANRSHDLYQNMLYMMIEEGIRCGCVQVNLGRTAAEIKTTVGAAPHDLLCYIKPQNTISRLIQRPFINFLQPQPWIPRNPFRETTEGTEKPTRA